jgi:PAS domain S-box-containing protein
MPLSATNNELHRLYDHLRAIRGNLVVKYAIAVGVVALAILLRLSVSGHMMTGVPFITFYPAVIIVALLCGLWPGLLATALSALGAWYFFLPHYESWTLTTDAAFALILFIIVCLVNVGLVMFLSKAIEGVMAQEANVRVLLESAPNGIVVVDTEGRIKLVNASAERLFGYQRAELVDQLVELLVPGREAGRHQGQREAFQKRPMARHMGAGGDLTGRRKDGSEFPVEIGLNPVARDGNRAILATVLDITDRKRAAESQQLIIRELQHRTKNLIAVIQAVIARSLDDTKTIAEAKEAVDGRLRALARAYDLLADTAWEGASLGAIAERQLEGFSERVQVEGCDIIVGPSAAQQFALIVHELATNAAKYGALSTASGRVCIKGACDDGVFLFHWSETGGPPVSVPTRRGFGSVILVDAARPFGQSVSMNFALQGLTYELAIPLESIERSKRTGAAHRGADQPLEVAVHG